ncbi:hypothetical protein BLA29_004794 [Euroglyphus maynei]|uniref:VWFC domain-containing protein n=1 Tax=Euroglyphus maynei TaxID=6958 RepID=A0A1Y3BNU9_EURMA|nr:hypothetical protein BLA29_004794 [Euroglyphus maynei]
MKENWPIIPNAIQFNPQSSTNEITVNKDKIIPNFEPMEQATNSSPIRTQPQSPIRPVSTHKLIPSSSIDQALRLSLSSSSTHIPMMTTTTAKPLTSSTNMIGNIHSANNLMPNIFQVSSCNIYGTIYGIDEQIKELSNQCKICICSITGVKCTDNC